MKALDLTGQRFGRLTAIKKTGTYISPSGAKKIQWLCKCDCGAEIVAIAADLRSGHTNSCGCYQKERTSEASKTHGMRYTAIYHVWSAMKDRCGNPRNKRYEDWGGRGITVCDEWKNDFQAFYDYVSKLPHFGEAGYSLDRINNDGNYEPNNVRWATRIEQNSNKRGVKHGIQNQ